MGLSGERFYRQVFSTFVRSDSFALVPDHERNIFELIREHCIKGEFSNKEQILEVLREHSDFQRFSEPTMHIVKTKISWFK